ncbi:FecR domain-containing protein [Acinetobacter baumannii]|uniref:FecR family protein n=1 Tax=Acinetobacter baumannii TaxID=470 RepID=A0AAP1QV54_ACIBA|nr:FecR family protein [Acinetobacter baumannii]MBD2848971.1 FecR family protein [Acinetobacter baumannii]MBD3134251.1 FecR family protein [Acinetobacter baumannii]MBE0305785.1 FecR family protein [Acinetobacter baumannii]MBE0313135.1 FecR family protein [Acinetobacter baumannii]MBE0329047.1 FecR family protein [Acinetobacter baumannii]
MSDITKIPPHVLDAAADWLVLLHSGEMTALQQQQFEQWKTEKKEHLLALQQMEKLSHGLSNLAGNFPSEALVQSNQKFNLAAKRNMLLSLSGLMIIGLSAYFIPWEKWQSDYHTKVGEIRKVSLKDGSQLIMASDCYVDVNFTKEKRQIKLIDGEIYVETAKDAQHRPFIVETKNGSVEALGTQFTVRQENSEQTKVKVYKHAVAIEPENASKRQILKQGQRAFFDEKYISKALPLDNDQPYWTQQLLVVDQWPLQKVLDELFRYKKGTYHLDPELKNLKISGVFSLKNPEQSLETLAYSHQLELNYYSQYLLSIKKR